MDSKTQPIINIQETGIEYRIKLTRSGKYTACVYKNGKQFSPESGAYDYEGVHAWLRLMIGTYPDSYLEKVS